MALGSKDNGVRLGAFRGGWRRLAFVAVAVAAVFAGASYRELLQAATPLAEADRPAFEHAVAYGGDIAKILQNEFEQLSVGMTSIQERIAAAHAISRAHGAEYLSSIPDVNDPFKLYNVSPVRVIVYYYKFNRNKAGLFRPIYPWGNISIHYALDNPKPSYTSLPESENRFLFTAGVSSLLKPLGPAALRSVVRPDCPPVPTNTWEARYLDNLNKDTPEQSHDDIFGK